MMTIEMRGDSVNRYKPTWESLKEHGVPEWYEDAKFGIFIHWGLYSVPAWAVPSGELGEVPREEWFKMNPYAEWYLNTLRIEGSPTRKYHVEKYGKDFQYEKFADMWKAEKWDPEEWAELFKKVGARYVVITTKHHEGFCLWPSKYTDYRVQVRGPNRDIVGELAKSVRNAGMRFGTYYSGALDWRFTKDPILASEDLKLIRPQTYGYADYAFNQFMELIDLYMPDILWNDIGWPQKGWDDLKYLFAYFYNQNPDGLVNDRWDVNHWDFRTAEYKERYQSDIPPFKWEFCRGLGFSFGYNQNEGPEHILTVEQLIEAFVLVVSKGGNFLLNVGPKADGTIPEIQRERLLGLGKWLEENGEAIYGSRTWVEFSGISEEGVRVGFTKKNNYLYVIVLDRAPNEITLKDIALKDGTEITCLKKEEPIKFIESDGKVKMIIPDELQGEYGLSFRIFPIPDKGSSIE